MWAGTHDIERSPTETDKDLLVDVGDIESLEQRLKISDVFVPKKIVKTIRDIAEEREIYLSVSDTEILREVSRVIEQFIQEVVENFDEFQHTIEDIPNQVIKNIQFREGLRCQRGDKYGKC